MSKLITALYDCRSKQEYIYRTNKIKEISGGSALLSHVYEMFINKCLDYDITINSEWKGKAFSVKEFETSSDDGTVIYEGGGNLYVLYKSKEIYLKANKIFSKMLLDETYTISVIASCVEYTGDFNKDRGALYEENQKQKNTGSFSLPCNSLPFTQLDRNTWMPVVKKEKKDNQFQSYSCESLHKIDAYNKYCTLDPDSQTALLDSLVLEKNTESLLAVIYIDGNAMGNKIKSLTHGINDYDTCVNKLRAFSQNTNKAFVDDPIKSIERLLEETRNKIDQKKDLTQEKKDKLKDRYKYRKIIGGGDEITIICNARAAKDIVLKYFESLNNSEPLVSGVPNASCAGIAIFHSHDPFSEIYKIAEACCETGKEKTRKNESKDNYIDFHYCHSGIVNDLETIRAEQEADYTNRPYELKRFKEFCDDAKDLSAIGRQNIKALRDSSFKGASYFAFEAERILSRYHDSFESLKKKYDDLDSSDDKITNHFERFVYDVSLVYDIWFTEEDEQP
ncbi:hypothetical protein [Ruminococcus sp. HUN007]|uniref:Cas10/Cmr2 second palm domain-containing protein n=1 Tax=Ruminococcus sp. HUN007 TaxID=1514668 RepID=UPI0005D1B456|nr:hypothetical protein [Ruminococcus sp. HUN007]